MNRGRDERAIQRLAGALRQPRLRAAGLVLPLVAFIAVTFVAPVATMLVRSVYDPVVADALPETLDALRQWDGEGAPPEAVYAAAARELLHAARSARSGGSPAASTACRAGCGASWCAACGGCGRSLRVRGARR